MIHKTTYHHLNQLKQVIVQLNEQQFSRSLPILEDSAIGKHVRHILEFYLCLCNSLGNRELNYDVRKRDHEMEVSVDKCIVTINVIIQKLHRHRNDFQMRLTADHSTDDNKKEAALNTTYFRELQYNIEHIVHHLAIIRIGIKTLGSPINIDDSIGVAASTIKNRKLCVQ